MSVRIALPSGQVTFLFTDIEGSTRLAQVLGDDYRPMLTEHRRILCDTVTRYGGIPLFLEGDSLFVAFVDPRAAVAACVDAQHALRRHDWRPVASRPRVRMGLHTGYAEPAGGEYASPEVHRANRVAAAAHGGQILCSAGTARAAGPLAGDIVLLDLGLHRLRGFDQRERLHQVVAPGLEREFPRPRTAQCLPHNLPRPLAPFVGRVDECAALRQHLARHRLVTVTGAAGAGKTRLTVEVALGQVAEHPDGVWLVDLAPLADRAAADQAPPARYAVARAAADRAGVARAIADALAIRPEPGRPMLDSLAEHLATRSTLLVMDTCDALPGATAVVLRRLLGAAPGLRVLATSRQPLGMPGELVHRVPPLSLRPGPGGLPSDAVALMLDRAASARGGRLADEAERDQLAAVAASLGGLPLAMELAARRLSVLTPAQLVARLDDPLATLDAGGAPPSGRAQGRHGSVGASIGWSYHGLAPAAARLLRGMAVFAGPVDLAAVAALTGEDPLDPVAVLADRCLVQAEPGESGMTYGLLDPFRAFALRELATAGEEPAARRGHQEWVRARLRAVVAGPDGRPQTLSMYALDPIAAELRAALGWSVSRGSGRDALALMTGMDHWWLERGLAREARLWFAHAYARIDATGEAVPDAELAQAYHLHAAHAGADGEYAEETRYGDLAVAAARRSGDSGLLARVLSGRSAVLLDMVDAVSAERTCREVIAWARERGVAADALFAICCLARLLWRRGALAEAAGLLAAARPLESMRPAERGRRTIDMILGTVALARGDLVAAHEHLVVALRSRARYGFHAHACETLHAFAVCCALGGEPVLAARLFGAAQANRSRLRVGALLVESYWAIQEKELRERLGDGEFDAAYAEGAALDLATAIPLALAVSHPDLAAGSSRFGQPASRAS